MFNFEDVVRTYSSVDHFRKQHHLHGRHTINLSRSGVHHQPLDSINRSQEPKLSHFPARKTILSDVGDSPLLKEPILKSDYYPKNLNYLKSKYLKMAHSKPLKRESNRKIADQYTHHHHFYHNQSHQYPHFLKDPHRLTNSYSKPLTLNNSRRHSRKQKRSKRSLDHSDRSSPTGSAVRDKVNQSYEQRYRGGLGYGGVAVSYSSGYQERHSYHVLGGHTTQNNQKQKNKNFNEIRFNLLKTIKELNSENKQLRKEQDAILDLISTHNAFESKRPTESTSECIVRNLGRMFEEETKIKRLNEELQAERDSLYKELKRLSHSKKASSRGSVGPERRTIPSGGGGSRKQVSSFISNSDKTKKSTESQRLKKSTQLKKKIEKLVEEQQSNDSTPESSSEGDEIGDSLEISDKGLTDDYDQKRGDIEEFEPRFGHKRIQRLRRGFIPRGEADGRDGGQGKDVKQEKFRKGDEIEIVEGNGMRTPTEAGFGSKSKNLMKKNIRNLKRFMQAKKVNEEIHQYVEYILELMKSDNDYLRMRCDQLSSNLNKMKNSEIGSKERTEKYKARYKALKLALKDMQTKYADLVEKNNNLEQAQTKEDGWPVREAQWEIKRLKDELRIKEKEVGLLIKELRMYKTNIRYYEQRNPAGLNEGGLGRGETRALTKRVRNDLFIRFEKNLTSLELADS